MQCSIPPPQPITLLTLTAAARKLGSAYVALSGAFILITIAPHKPVPRTPSADQPDQHGGKQRGRHASVHRAEARQPLHHHRTIVRRHAVHIRDLQPAHQQCVQVLSSQKLGRPTPRLIASHTLWAGMAAFWPPWHLTSTRRWPASFWLCCIERLTISSLLAPLHLTGSYLIANYPPLDLD